MAAPPVQMAPDQIGRMFRIMGTVGELCQDRKYLVPQEWGAATMETFKQKYMTPQLDAILRQKMTLLCNREDTGAQMIVFFTSGDLGVQHIKDYEKKAAENRINKVILVVSGRINPVAKKMMQEMSRQEEQVHFQCFDEDDLVVNITHHELVPEHTPLEPDEAKNVLDAHCLQISMLPRMLSTDPIALYFGLDRGRVVRIKRKSETAGVYVAYRQVV